MRALLILVVLVPVMGTAAWLGARSYLRRIRRHRHIEEMLRENEQLDRVIHPREESRGEPRGLTRPGTEPAAGIHHVIHRDRM